MITFNKVGLEYIKGDTVLDSISFEIQKGEFVYVTGKSGAGKTSLLRMIYADLRPVRGIVNIFGNDITYITPQNIPYLRRQIGIIFQDFKLIEYKTVFENVRMALEIFDLNKDVVEKRIFQLLHKLGIFDKRDDLIVRLSGGEKQRVAIARALVNDPYIIIADEPTGNMDPENAMIIAKMLANEAQSDKIVLMATHDMFIRKYLPRREIHLSGGKIERDGFVKYS